MCIRDSIKAMDPILVKQAHEEDWPFVKAVHAGCSVAPPAGEPDMNLLIEALADLDKELYVCLLYTSRCV